MSDTEGYMVIKIENGEPVGHPITYTNIKSVYPTEVFPIAPVRKQMLQLGYDIFYIENEPYVYQTHVEQDGYIFNEQNNAWTYKWKLIPFTAEEMQIDQQKEVERKWAEMRGIRNAKLIMSDWTHLTDTPLSTEQKQQWANYRQQLRDFPSTVTDIDNLTWPAQP